MLIWNFGICKFELASNSPLFFDMFSSLDLFPTDSSIRLSKCYLECLATTPLSSIEKFLRIKHSIPLTLKVKVLLFI
jgi:hypothetical protein